MRLKAYVGNFSSRYPLCKRTVWVDDIDIAFGDGSAAHRFMEFVDWDEETSTDSQGKLFSILGIYEHLFRTIFPALIRQGIFRVHFTLYHQCDEVRETFSKYGFQEVDRGVMSSEWICDTLTRI